MIILVIGGLLLGAIFGRFFTVLVLVPAFALSLAIVVASSAYFGHTLLRALLEFAVLITSLQIGYVSGVVSHAAEIRGNSRFPPDRQPCRSRAGGTFSALKR